MKFDDSKLKEILLRENYISAQDVADAETAKTTILEYTLSKNILTKDLLGQAIAESFSMPYADLNSKSPSATQVQKISEDVAKKLRVVIFEETDTGVTVATDTPDDPNLLAELAAVFPSKKVALAYGLEEDIDASFLHYQKPLATRFAKIIADKGRIAPELLEEIFDDAGIFKASDIHFEPQRSDVLIRFRIDGVLHEAGRIPNEYYENILNRIKVKSGLRIDEHMTAQDGSLRYEKNSVAVDMRTSILPTVVGEKVVLRLLGAYVQGLSLENLGLSKFDQEKLITAAEKPFGMILVVGPTGSGKTTTLYGILKILNNPKVNITTIEDPVEYKVDTVNQIQVNPATSLTFAKGLRSIVRQDPDIILVGEIRDEETAEIAVNASLTGHLLLSTFHANDAATAVPRLLDMGVEPFLLASTLQVIVAQRLVRKICDHCKYSFTWEEKDFKTPKLRSLRTLFEGKTVTFYKGKGCEVCGDTGYNGRTAIFECISMTPALQELILQSPSSREIGQLAQSEGARSMFEDGIEKVKNGITTLEELLRVAEPGEIATKQSEKIRAKKHFGATAPDTKE